MRNIFILETWWATDDAIHQTMNLFFIKICAYVIMYYNANAFKS